MRLICLSSLLPAFHSVFQEHGEIFRSQLEEYADSGEPLDIQSLYFRFTLESIGKIAFGTQLGPLLFALLSFAL